MEAPPTFLSIGSCFAMAIYGADSPPPRRYGCRIPRSRALHALLFDAIPPVEFLLPLVERLVDLLYDFFFLFLAGAAALDAVAFDAVVLDTVRFLFLVLGGADADALAFWLLAPDAAEVNDLRDFLLTAVSFESSPFLLDNRNPFTPAPEPPITSFRPLIHEKESDVFRLTSI